MLLEKCDSDVHEWVPGGIDGSEEVCRFCGWPKGREIFFLAQRVSELEQQHDAAVAILREARAEQGEYGVIALTRRLDEALAALGADAKEED